MMGRYEKTGKMKRTKIVVLDGYTLNSGDLSWAGLEEFGDCLIHDRSAPEQTIERATGAEIVLTNKTVLSAEIIEKLPDLRYIGVLATGYNVVDVVAARERGIPVTNVPAYGTVSVAQMVFAHLLNLTQRVGDHADTVKEGRWCRSPDYCYWDFPLIELAGKTIGIVGYGRIGQAVSVLAKAFGMRVLANKKIPPESVPDGISFVDLETLFRESDVVSLHCPLTEATQHMVDHDLLDLMKPTAFLINTSRGPLIDEAALAEALNTERIAGAGLDVLAAEPASPECPLLKAKNCYITPHIAWATHAARQRLMEGVVENVRAFLAGTPRNVVNGL